MPTVQTGDIATSYERRGDGPPIVFVHGTVLDHSQWDPQTEALHEAYTTYTSDVRGHGRTGGSYRAFTRSTCSPTTWRRSSAHSTSSGPSSAASRRAAASRRCTPPAAPDRLSGLVLADTFTPELPSPGEWLQRSLLLRATVPPVRLLGYERVEKALV